ncbi:MAG: endonuclease/exonuclease/phosphatase family protein [Clostridia bacterium]|nr:endonuclease/exonuclease/phosphatase family protein [Clostridia bacterium]
MRIMTSNIWGDYFGNPVSVREGGLYSIFTRYSPDILGFQEVTASWYKGDALKKLSEEYFFVGTEMFESKNFVPFCYKKSSGLDLIEKGYEYLADTPDISKGITWGVFKSDACAFAVCNTHFWWKEGKEHDRIREKNAKQLCERMQYIRAKYSCPVFAMGDLNCTHLSTVFEVFSENGVQKLFDKAVKKSDVCSHHGDPVKEKDGTYRGCRTQKGAELSIDHILMLGRAKVLQYTVVEDQEALDATDHSPVFADVEL